MSRQCETCGAGDRAALDFDIPCNPKLCPPDADERPETHHDNCPALMHEVRKLYRPATLEHTAKHPEGELQGKWRREGWKLLKDGRDLFRWKLLCRDCIQSVYDREDSHDLYLQACKKARGEDDQTYSQLLTQQANS